MNVIHGPGEKKVLGNFTPYSNAVEIFMRIFGHRGSVEGNKCEARNLLSEGRIDAIAISFGARTHTHSQHILVRCYAA